VLTALDVRRILGTALPVRRLFLGEEFDTWAVGDDLVAKFALTDTDAGKVPLEAAVHPMLRELLGDVVPAIRDVGEMTPGGFRYIVHDRARGTQGQTDHGETIEPAPGLAEDAGRLLGRIHSMRAEVVFALGLGERGLSFEGPTLDERTVAVATEQIGERLDAFIEAPRPQPSRRRVLCHTDLKGEHVFVAKDRGSVTAIIDWADTEVCDPARDYAGLVIWLGGQFAASAIEASGEEDDTLLERAVWLARAGTLDHWNEVVAGRARGPEGLIMGQLRTAFGVSA
jgi:aminoglycoside phosphotransferase (APT) family kinase protein